MATFEYTKNDLKTLEMFLIENEEHFSNFMSGPEQFATEVFTKLKELNLQIGSVKLNLWIIKCMIVKCSDKYHDLFKYSEDAYLRELIAKHSDKYHHLFKDHGNDNIRYIVAKFSGKYDNEFKNDSYWRIRKLVKDREFENGKLINDGFDINKNGIINIKQLITDILKISKEGIILPILDEKCLEFFFDTNILKDYEINKIVSVYFIYKHYDIDPFPLLLCKIIYKTENNKNKSFVYMELKSQYLLDTFNEEIKNYCDYLNGWLEAEHRKAGGNLKISQMVTFMEKINILDKYLVPKDNLLVYLDEKYSIV